VKTDWDARKARDNLAKHGVSFEEAATALDDQNALLFFDEGHSGNEDRFVTIGMSEKPRLLYVVYTERDEDTVRIISARKADKAEQRLYAEGLGGG
jgi:uncharacterized protein